VNKCGHPATLVVTNITQADAVWRHTVPPASSDPKTYNVQWCRRCGAYRIMFGDDEFGMQRPGEWQVPELVQAGLSA
jgi:hypothetical protein